MNRFELISLAKQIAKQDLLDPALVCAVVEQESNWDQWAMRFEWAFMQHYVRPLIPEAPTTGEFGRATSWGLMQLLGETAREMGFAGSFPELCVPEINLTYGCKKLYGCIQARGDVSKALLMWNGGANGSYPQQVLARMKNYQT